MHVDSVVFSQRAKYRIKIIHILSYTKMTKSDRFGRVQILHCSLLSKFQICHFCAAQNTRYYFVRFYTSVGFNIFYMQDFFQNFLQLQIVVFKIFKIKAHCSPGSISPLS